MANTFKKLIYEILFIGARISWKKVTNPTLFKKKNERDFTINLSKMLLKFFAPFLEYLLQEHCYCYTLITQTTCLLFEALSSLDLCFGFKRHLTLSYTQQ